VRYSSYSNTQLQAKNTSAQSAKRYIFPSD
jgi:hypothetical protein